MKKCCKCRLESASFAEDLTGQVLVTPHHLVRLMLLPPMLPNPLLERVVPMLRDHANDFCESLSSDGPRWAELFDASASDLFEAHLKEAGADEGTIWLLDQDQTMLVPMHNNGPHAAQFVATYRQPLDKGIVSTVCVTQSGICESWVYQNPQHDPTANKKLDVITVHMIAMPLYFCGDTRGVISGVKLRGAGTTPADDPPAFTPSAMTVMRRSAFLIGELIDGRVLRSVLGIK